jgi:ADP-ribose pyrophosphatase YjhB (NUDIX family)
MPPDLESSRHEPLWVELARELQAMAQTGLHFSQDPFDIARYVRVREIAARMTAEGFDLDPLAVGETFAGLSGYATPQVDVRGALFRGDRVLLVREQRDGKWALPGGWADVNRSPAENVVREVEEEAGLRVAVRKLAAVYDRRRHPYAPPEPLHCYKLYFICDWLAGEPRAGDETEAAEFFPVQALPELSRARVIEPHILRAYEHYLAPDLPPDFD